MTLVTGNILDPISDKLDPTVWEKPDSDMPILRPAHAHWITSTIYDVLENGGYSHPERWLDLVLTGSLTTYQYSADSDCDVSLFINASKLPEWSRAEMIGLMIDGFDERNLPGTSHPMQCYVVAKGVHPADLYKKGLRAGYDIKKHHWIEPPDHDREHDVEAVENGFWEYAKEQADKMERLLRYEPEKAVTFWRQIHKRRMHDQSAGKGDFAESNIVYKFLNNRGLFPQIAEMTGEHVGAYPYPGEYAPPPAWVDRQLAVSETPGTMNWQQGGWGRGLIGPDGTIHTWPVSDLTSGGKPHHRDYAAEQGIGPKDYSNPVIIGPSGWYTHNAGPDQLSGDVNRYAQQYGMNYSPDYDIWERNAGGKIASIEAAIVAEAGAPPWQPGTWGKGLTLDGEPHIWTTNGPGGSPHHQQYLQQIGRGNQHQADPTRGVTDGVVIAPDGSYTLQYGFQSENPVDPSLLARTQPGMRFMPNQDKWQMRAFGSHVGALKEAIAESSATMPAMQNSSIADTAVQATLQHGGVTIGLNGQQPNQGFAFSIQQQNEEKVPQASLTPQVVEEYIQRHLKDLSQPGRYLGMWASEGQVYMDVSQVEQDQQTAHGMAQNANQLAMYDLSNFNEIPIQRDTL